MRQGLRCQSGLCGDDTQTSVPHADLRKKIPVVCAVDPEARAAAKAFRKAHGKGLDRRGGASNFPVPISASGSAALS